MPVMQLPELDWQPEDYLRAFWLHKGIILLTVLVFWLTTAFTMAQKPNIYDATARLLIEADRAHPMEFREMTPYVDPYDPSFLRTEYEIITSPPILQGVVELMNLAVLPPFSRADDRTSMLKGMILVQPVRGTRLVDIVVSGEKPELVAHIANSVADTYTRFNLERRQEMTSGGASWLKDEVAKMEGKMRSDQMGLQAFREKYTSLDFGEETQNAVLQRLQDLNNAITGTKKERIEAEGKYREKHPLVRELYAKEMQLQMALMEQEEQATEMNRLSIQYSALVRQAKTSEEVYNVLLTRMKELSVQEGLQTNNVKVVSYAKVPKEPVSPKRQQASAVAVVMGFLVGCGLTILREALAKTLRNRKDFDRILQIPFLGHVPAIQTKRRHTGKERLLLLTDPHAPAAEAIRSIRTTLDFMLPAGQPHVLVLTSALPEEGKSLISLNLAMAFQEIGKKVVLVEADMRRPTLQQILSLQPEPSLSGYLQVEKSPWELVQIPLGGPPIPVIPAGSTPAQPADLLASPRMQELRDALKQQYQYVLFDTPPVLVAADTTVLVKLADATVYVVRAGRTHRDVVLAGKQRLVDVGAHLIGGILNRANLELEQGYRYYYYSRGVARKRTGSRSGSEAPKAPPSAVSTG